MLCLKVLLSKNYCTLEHLYFAFQQRVRHLVTPLNRLSFFNNNEKRADQTVEVKGQLKLKLTVGKQHKRSVQFLSPSLRLTSDGTRDGRFTCKILEVSGYLLLPARQRPSELNHLRRTTEELPHNS